MGYLLPFLLIAGGILACSSLIVAKKPEAKDLIAKLAPFQAIIGAGLLVLGVLHLVTNLDIFKAISMVPVMVLTILAMIFSAILLGILFGMPMVAKLSAGGAAKGDEIARKFAPYQTLIGIVGIASSVMALLFAWRILPWM
jgi:hypothetical protein